MILNPLVSLLLCSAFEMLSMSFSSEGDKLASRPGSCPSFVVNVLRLECSPGDSKIIGKKKEAKSYFNQILQQQPAFRIMKNAAAFCHGMS